MANYIVVETYILHIFSFYDLLHFLYFALHLKNPLHLTVPLSQTLAIDIRQLVIS